MIEVKLELKSTLKKYFKNTKSFKLDENSTVYSLITLAGIPGEEISLITIDGKRVNREEKLKDKNKIIFYPIVGGG